MELARNLLLLYTVALSSLVLYSYKEPRQARDEVSLLGEHLKLQYS